MRTPEEIDRAIGLVYRTVATRQLLPVPGGYETQERLKKIWEAKKVVSTDNFFGFKVLTWVKGEDVDFASVLTLLEDSEASEVTAP